MSYAEKLSVLSTYFETLSRRLGIVRENLNEPNSGEQQRSGTVNNSRQVFKVVRYHQSAVEALQCAIRNTSSVLEVVMVINNAANPERHFIGQNQSIVHLRHMQHLEEHKNSQTVLALDI